ncbi:MAG: polymer-forming cytoskeletal protein [Proteobacteria bacterium]|nr:polymer-forming cytoskeletal protein [Pseudomonadota bacterium]
METTPAKADNKQQQVPTIISASLRIVGNLISDGDVQVDGIIDGNVKSRTLTIGESATINGEVEAETVRIHGSISGQIKAKKVELGPTAKVVGDIIHSLLIVESGAYLEGSCRHLDSARKDAESKPADTKPADTSKTEALAKALGKPSAESVASSLAIPGKGQGVPGKPGG